MGKKNKKKGSFWKAAPTKAPVKNEAPVEEFPALGTTHQQSGGDLALGSFVAKRAPVTNYCVLGGIACGCCNLQEECTEWIYQNVSTSII